MIKVITGLKKSKNSFKNIFTAEEFKALITYERSRSDRNGSVFSVIILDTSGINDTDTKKIMNKISEVARKIDCIGYYEQDKVGILLPDTKEEGAVVLGNKIVTELKYMVEDVHLDIYSYPDHWLSNLDEKSSSQREKHSSNKEIIEHFFVGHVPHWKRALDIIVSLTMLIIGSPVLLLTSLYIKIVSPGPVFFTQNRIGYKGIPFKFYKFRSMHHDNNQSFHGKHSQSFIKSGDIPMEKLDSFDPRIIPGGKILRKTCIDELPQLWNVLIGDMSLVGPRPCIPYEAEEYLRWHTHRFDTVPGLTGLWQVSGKNKLTFKEMIRLDITYCRNMSFWGDVKIIFKTPLIIFEMIMDSTIKKINEEVEDNTEVNINNTTKQKAH